MTRVLALLLLLGLAVGCDKKETGPPAPAPDKNLKPGTPPAPPAPPPPPTTK